MELSALAAAAANRLGLENGEVALLGGLLRHDKCLRAAFMADLMEKAPGLRCVEPRQDAAAGAAMLAVELLGKDLP